MHKKQRVVIIQEHMPHYRSKFFTLLHEELAKHDIELCLIHGKVSDSRMLSRSPVWADAVEITKIGPFSWHRLGSLCDGASLIVVPQEIKYLRLHLLLLSTRFNPSKFAYWGHGKNFQSSNHQSLAEKCKRFLSRKVDWWFAYNNLSSKIVAELGFPQSKITSVGNTVDIAALSEIRNSISESNTTAIRNELGIQSNNVAIYTGALYSHKRISFLLESANLIRSKVPDFELIIIGDGPDRDLVMQAAKQKTWLHYLGSKNDQEKVPYWAISKLLLMPGLVGLVIVDSFALGVPMITTDYPLHSPEIDYLKNGVNGILIECGESREIYADYVVDLLKNPSEIEKLKNSALSSASEHTIESMVENFTGGLFKALRES